MSQAKSFTWTNAASAVARNVDCGFKVSEVTVVDETNGGSFYWNDQMDDASVLDVDAGTIATTNGVTPLAQNALFGSAISAFTNANPGVLTVADAVTAGYVAGDTIKVVGIAESGSGTSLNAEYVIASISGNALTTGTDTSAYGVWVSGGYAGRKTNAAGDAIAVNNDAIRGVTLGTSAVGANSAVMNAVCKSSESVL